MKTMQMKLLVLSLLFLLSCSDDGGDGVGLQISRNTVTLKVGEDTQSVQIESSEPWEASVPEADEWCSVMKVSETKLAIMAVANESPETRYTTVTIIAGDKTEHIAVGQLGAFQVRTRPEQIQLKACGDTVKVIVETNFAWTCTVDDPWCHLKRIADTLWVSADTSSSDREKNTRIVLSSGEKKDAAALEVNQLPYIDPELTADVSGMVSLAMGAFKDIRISSRLPWTYNLQGGEVTIERISEEILRVTAPATGYPNISIIFVTAGEREYEKTLTLMVMYGS